MSRRIPIGILRQIVNGLFGQKSNRQIAALINHGISHYSVSKIRSKVKESGLNEEAIKKLDDIVLSELIYGKAPSPSYAPSEARDYIISEINYYRKELKEPGVTKWLLWQDLIENFPQFKNSCSYSTFCRILSENLSIPEVTLVNRIPSSESVVMIDFAGKKLHYTNRDTNKKIYCIVLVAVMERSLYSFGEIIPDARTYNVLEALNNCMEYFGGVPDRLLTDNMAQLVKKAHKYEPTFTDAATFWANHYGIFLSATRVAKPRDKQAIERLVNIAYTRIYAPLRDRVFYSFEDLQRAVKERLEVHNNMLLTGKKYSRKEKFIEDEQPNLTPLPDTPFELQKCTSSKVNKESHVLLGEDKCHYSVPYKYIGKTLNVQYTSKNVEIYHLLTLVASHPRSLQRGKYITDKDHLPANIKAQMKINSWTKQDYVREAIGIGPHTKLFVEAMFASKKYESYAYRSCQGVLTLGTKRKYGPERLEQACQLAGYLHKFTYKDVEKILKNEGDIYFKALGRSLNNRPLGDQTKQEEADK